MEFTNDNDRILSIYANKSNPYTKINEVISSQNAESLRKKVYVDVPKRAIWNPIEDPSNDEFIKDMQLVESIKTGGIKKESQKLGYSTLQVARYS